VVIPFGRSDLGSWYDRIINVYSNPKPDIIVAHSEGGFLAMKLAEDHPGVFSKYLIFNVPLILYTSDGWIDCYSSRAKNISDNVTIIMSEQDTHLPSPPAPPNGIMGWSTEVGVSMYDAINAIRNLNLSNITIPTPLNVDGYEHSPFSVSVALDKFKEVTGSNS